MSDRPPYDWRKVHALEACIAQLEADKARLAAALRCLEDRCSRVQRNLERQGWEFLAQVMQDTASETRAALAAVGDVLTPEERAQVESYRPVNADGSLAKGFTRLPWWFAVLDRIAPKP